MRSSSRVPCTREALERLDKNLCGDGVLRRLPTPASSSTALDAPLFEKCVNLWRAVLDLAWLDYLRGPGNGSAKDAEQREAYWDACSWLFAGNGKFEEICDRAFLDPVLIKSLIIDSGSAKRELALTDGDELGG